MVKVTIVRFTGAGVPLVVAGEPTAATDEKQGGQKPALRLVKGD
jgi:hypothetical protein